MKCSNVRAVTKVKTNELNVKALRQAKKLNRINGKALTQALTVNPLTQNSNVLMLIQVTLPSFGEICMSRCTYRLSSVRKVNLTEK
jgi:hypothetical protein